MTISNILRCGLLVSIFVLASSPVHGVVQKALDIRGIPNDIEKLGRNMDWSNRFSTIDAAGFAYLSYAVAVDAYVPMMTVRDQTDRYGRSLEIAGFTVLPDSLYIASWKEMDFFAFATPTAVVIVFRGTESPKAELSNIRDWFTDGDIRLGQFPGFAGRVHTGFHNSYIEGEHLLSGYLNAHANKPIYVTGHSLGGAIATVAAYRLQRQGKQIRGIYPFANPRVGDPAFAGDYNRRVGNRSYRIKREGDHISAFPHFGRSPLGGGGYEHTGPFREIKVGWVQILDNGTEVASPGPQVPNSQLRITLEQSRRADDRINYPGFRVDGRLSQPMEQLFERHAALQMYFKPIWRLAEPLVDDKVRVANQQRFQQHYRQKAKTSVQQARKRPSRPRRSIPDR